MKIVYMGTPDFAVAPLEALLKSGFNIVGVVTMPDKPAGRGHLLQASPIKRYALAQGLPVLQPEHLKSKEFLQQLQNLHADLQIVTAFRMLPEVVWDMPPMGTFNLHASLLPQYRGAAPINWAIINGERETGVTTFMLQHDIDTGDILLQERTPIAPDDTAGTLHDRLMQMGADLVLRTATQMQRGTLKPHRQPVIEPLRPAPKIFRETCQLRFDATVDAVRNFVRGLSPYPTAWFACATPQGAPMVVKVFDVTVEHVAHTYRPSTLCCDGKRDLKIAVADGWVHIRSLQLAGKRRMTTEELLRGYKFANDTQVVEI